MYISGYIINPTFVLAVSIQKQNVQNSFKMADGFEMVFKFIFFIKSYKARLKESWYGGLILPYHRLFIQDQRSRFLVYNTYIKGQSILHSHQLFLYIQKQNIKNSF